MPWSTARTACAVLLLLAATISCTSAYTEEALADQVFHLPYELEPPRSNQFSGFLQIQPDRYIHYYYFESENSPENDSVVFWTNGGPGCSGLLGLFTEMGPWRPMANGSIGRNPFSWTTKTSMVFLEQPVGVGFSFTTDTKLLRSFNDYRASVDNLRVLKAFFEKFPERKTNDFYLASESYGGHYIPQWTLQVLNDPNGDDLRRRFKGYLVGNAFTSYASGSIAFANVLWGLQLIPKPAWDLLTGSSCELLSHDAYFFAMYLPQCFDYMDALFVFAEDLNPYALDFPICPNSVSYTSKSSLAIEKPSFKSHSVRSRQAQVQFHRGTQYVTEKLRRVPNDHPSSKGNFQRMASILGDRAKAAASRIPMTSLAAQVTTQNNNNNLTSGIKDPRAPFYDPCAETYTHHYLNKPEVQEALHVGSSSLRGRLGFQDDWSMCSDIVNGEWSFSDFLSDTTNLYSVIYNHPNKPKNFKMLVFSGDSDGVCATSGTQHWIYNIQGSRIVSLFKPWSYLDSIYNRQQGGFITKFTGMLTFVTVHYAGHEVPAYQPERALQMFSDYISGALFSTEPADAITTADDSTITNSSSSQNNQNLVTAIAFLVLIFAGLCIITWPKFRSKRPHQSLASRPQVADDLDSGDGHF